jgi:hypothetical protein
MNSSGFDKAWQPQVGFNNNKTNGNSEWWMDFELTFVKKNTNVPVAIDEFDLTAIDIDGNGDKIKEYVSFYGLDSYKTEINSLLTIKNLFGVVSGVNKLIGKQFSGTTRNFIDIDTNSTTTMVTASYIDTESFTVRTGGSCSGSSSETERMYSFYFRDFEYNAPQQSTLPVILESFDAKLVSDKVILNWVADLEQSFSHYIVERSTDGKVYNDATIIFGYAGYTQNASYTYTEAVRKGSAGLVYYRLKMVDIDGSYRYSAIRILRLNNSDQSVAITTFPNPVASELRITIPRQWQDQKVVYDMYSTNGTIVKRHISYHASQTESLNVSDMAAGTYIIKLTSGTESAVQQIVKSK